VLLLLIFVGIAAADALVLSTTGRRDELTLLHRTGSTRTQLLRMAALEALVTALLAWVIGTVSVVPAVLAVTVRCWAWRRRSSISVCTACSAQRCS
jgi:putative ABC transport system permease protein